MERDVRSETKNRIMAFREETENNQIIEMACLQIILGNSNLLFYFSGLFDFL